MMMDSSPPLLLGLGLGLEDRERSEIVFFDVETTVPSRTGQGFSLLEFGAILVCPKNLEELESYSTLVRPSDISAVSVSSVRCNGITREAVSSAPPFQQIADKVYDILHGRIWAGHNIIRFDCARIREAFAAIGRPPPEPKGTIDSLGLLTQRFGRRAGNMKMATLATYFGLGKQTHRSLDDVRMNLEVLKYCATVLFLESSLPDILTANGLDTPNAGMRTRSNRKHSDAGKELEVPSPFNMGMLIDTIKEPLEPDASMEGRSLPDTPVPAVNEGCSGYAGFLAPEEVSVDFLQASLVPSFRGGQRMQLMHKDLLLQLNCAKLRVRFGVSTKFLDHAGRPRLNIVLDVTPRLCQVLDVCDHRAQSLSVESGSSSEWKPVVFRKNGFTNLSTIRLHIPIIADGDNAIYSTDIYQKDASGTVHKLVFSKVDATQLESLLAPGTWLDVFFGLDVYDYQQNAGIRLVAKKLTICS